MIDEITGLPASQDKRRWHVVCLGNQGLGVYPTRAEARAAIAWKWAHIYPDQTFTII